MIKWSVRETSRGDFVAELKGTVEPGVEAGYKPGCYMGGILYESARFNTKREAQEYIKRRENEQ